MSEKRPMYYTSVRLGPREDGEIEPVEETLQTFPEHTTVLPVTSCRDLGETTRLAVHDVRPSAEALDFRRDALLFQRIAVPMLGWQIRNLFLTHHTADAEAKVAELAWLIEKAVIFEPPVYRKLPDPNVAQHHDECEADLQKIMDDYGMASATKLGKWVEDAHAKENQLCDLRARFKADEIMENEGITACPILNSSASFDSDIGGTSTDVLRIVFENIPTPDPSTPWERILKYRESDEAVHGLNGLRVWATEVAKGDLSPKDIREKLAWELNTHERYMSAHRMEMASGRMEIILTTAAEVVEQLVRLKFVKALRTVFSLRKQRAQLIKGEIAAPGRELAYINRTRDSYPEDNETNQEECQPEN